MHQKPASFTDSYFIASDDVCLSEDGVVERAKLNIHFLCGSSILSVDMTREYRETRATEEKIRADLFAFASRVLGSLNNSHPNTLPLLWVDGASLDNSKDPDFQSVKIRNDLNEVIIQYIRPRDECNSEMLLESAHKFVTVINTLHHA